MQSLLMLVNHLTDDLLQGAIGRNGNFLVGQELNRCIKESTRCNPAFSTGQ